MNYTPSPDANHVRGRVLRFLITKELQRIRQPMTIPEIVGRIEQQGFTIYGRPSKTVSDCLRWETAKGRVTRIKRGIYTYGHTSRSTLRRINLLSQTACEWIVAITRTQHTKPAHTNTQYVPKPWDNYHWLWRTELKPPRLCFINDRYNKAFGSGRQPLAPKLNWSSMSHN